MLIVEGWAEIPPVTPVGGCVDLRDRPFDRLLKEHSEGGVGKRWAAGLSADAGSVVDESEPRIRELLRAFPRMPATVIGERIGEPYSIRTMSGRVAELRPACLPPDPQVVLSMPPV